MRCLLIGVSLCLSLVWRVQPAWGQDYELLLKGGTVIDPRNNRNGPADVAIADGRIDSVSPDIPETRVKEVIDVRGLYVVPGLNVADMDPQMAAKTGQECADTIVGSRPSSGRGRNGSTSTVPWKPVAWQVSRF